MKKFLLLLAAIFCFTARAAEEANLPQGNKVVIGGDYFYVHTVVEGETLFSLARVYGITIEEITENNPHTIEGLRAGETIKIPAPEPETAKTNLFNRVSNRKVTVHTVNQGETAYSIAKRYGITVEHLIEANPGFDPVSISIGQKINIPKQLIGTATQTEIKEDFNQYSESLAGVTPGFGYHLVERGETLYSLSRNLDVPIDTLRYYNREELADGLKFGALLKYPTGDPQSPEPADDSSVSEEPAAIETLPENAPAHIRDFSGRGALSVALMLPLENNGQNASSFTDYYNGTLLALEDLKSEGISVDLTLYDTKRSTDRVESILLQLETKDPDLIIGPVYEEQFNTVARFAYEKGIPIVSPLSVVATRNPNAYQAAPDASYKYDKVRDLFTADKNVILILPDQGADSEFIRELTPLLPPHAVKISYHEGARGNTIQSHLSREMENVIIIPSLQEDITDKIMATISSIQKYLLSRTGNSYPVTTLGSSRWARFNNIDKQYFFDLNVNFITSYHADRGNRSIVEFDNRYLTAFQSIPSYSSYRGYDVTKIFATALHTYGRRYQNSINRIDTRLLQVPYEFVRSEEGRWVNSQWVRVNYRRDYIIEVK